MPQALAGLRSEPPMSFELTGVSWFTRLRRGRAPPSAHDRFQTPARIRSAAVVGDSATRAANPKKGKMKAATRLINHRLLLA